MRKLKHIFYGLIVTAIIYTIAIVMGQKITIGDGFFPNSFITHTAMLFLAIVAIGFTGKKRLHFRIALPRFKNIFKPFLVGLLITVVVNILMTIVTKLVGQGVEAHPILKQTNALQVFLFVFIFASIAEEFLFRGFLQNALKGLAKKGITLFKLRLSLPVIISAIAFGLSHLILGLLGVNFMFLIRVVLFTTVLGIAAGYHQEKHDNTAHAILVHMGGNLPALLGALLVNIQ